MTKFLNVFPLIIALSGAAFVFIVFGRITYDKASAQKQETIATVIDCRHVHSGRNGGYLVAFSIEEGQVIEYNTDTQYRIGDNIYVKYYYSDMDGKLYIDNIQKKYQ